MCGKANPYSCLLLIRPLGGKAGVGYPAGPGCQVILSKPCAQRSGARLLTLNGVYTYAHVCNISVSIYIIQLTLEQHGLGVLAPSTVENLCITLDSPKTLLSLSILRGGFQDFSWMPRSADAHTPHAKWRRSVHTVGPPHT